MGAAFLSAGFGTDGSLPETPKEPAPKPRTPEPDITTVPVAKKPSSAKAGSRSTAPKAAGDKKPAPAAATAVMEPVDLEPESPYDKKGSWYVIHAYSGHEKKVREHLDARTSSMHMQDRIFEIVIPTEKVVEIKGGRKVEVEKRLFPGYLLIRMYLDDDSWHAVRDTPGVTSFVGMGSGSRPTSLSKREVERFLGLKKEAAKKPPRFRPAWEIGRPFGFPPGRLLTSTGWLRTSTWTSRRSPFSSRSSVGIPRWSSGSRISRSNESGRSGRTGLRAKQRKS